ncbi:MAG: CobW family GTP-binding protein [Lachnospiraceae bacterium]
MKIDIISGFLGAGKTTLIRQLVQEAFAGEKIVIIENEFGEIGIDGGFLKESGIQVQEMNSGCICCSLVGDFKKSLKEVMDTYQPDRIVIEPSGVGKLSDVEQAVLDAKETLQLTLNSLTTVVDVKRCKLYIRNFGEFFNNQVETANTIILSRTDLATEAETESAAETLRQMNPEAMIITTPIEQLGGKRLLEIMQHPVKVREELTEEVCPTCGGHHHDHEEHEHHHDHEHHHHDHEEHEHHHHDHEEHEHHHHDHEEHEHHHHDHEEHEHHHHDHEEHEHHHHDHEEHEHHHHEHGEDCSCGCHGHHHDHEHHHAEDVFTSVGIETVHKFSKEELQESLEKLADEQTYGTILRAKGIVPSETGEWLYFDMVPEEIEIRTGAPDYSGRLCVIGAEVNQKNVKALFGA